LHCLRQSRGGLITGDENNGAIISWNDARNSGTTGIDIYGQRIDSLGNSKWMSDGIGIFIVDSLQLIRDLYNDGNHGALIVSWDYRNGNYDIYVQRIDSSGIKMWDSIGVPICTADSIQQYPAGVSDGRSGAIIAWQDKRNYSANNWDIYAQHIDSSGTVLWDTNGMAICIVPWGQGGSRVTTDMTGGAIIAWSDGRDGSTNKTYAQRVGDEPSGTIETWRREIRRRGGFLQIYPNPFTKLTTISFGVEQSAKSIELKIYDVTGGLVKTLVNESKGLGVYGVYWDGKDNEGNLLPSGIYFCQLSVDEQRLIQKLILLR